jgi:bestrophin-3
MRYVNLSTVLVYRLVSCKVHARFPTYESMIDANLMLPEEANRLKTIDQKTPHESTWIPFVWAMTLLQNARDEGKIIVSLNG